MADRTDYTKLLGERLERAYRAKDDIKPPSAEDIARWKRLAQAKRKEKRKRMKLIASLASVFAVAFCVSIVPMFKIPDAQAGEDYFVDMETLENDEESMITDIFSSYDDLPEDVKNEFYQFENLPEGYTLEEIKIITTVDKKECKSLFENSEGSSFLIRQTNSSDNADVVVNSDYIESWNGIDVYIKEYTDGAKNINYKFVIDNSFIDIMADRDVNKEVIKDTIKEAVF